MGLSGPKREAGDGGFLKVGLAQCKVLAFNPSKEELEKILGKDLEKDPEYDVDDDVVDMDDGSTKVFKKQRLNVWLEEVKTGMKFVMRQTLIDKIQESKSGKVRFVDNKGNLSYYVDSEENLVAFMKENPHWVLRVGEHDLYRFLRAWQSNMNRKEVEDFSFSWADLVRGKTKELNSWIGSEYEGNVLVLLCVKVDIKVNEAGEKEIKEYQDVYNRNFLPGDMLRYFTARGEVKSKMIKEFIKEVTDPEYGVKNFYGGVLGEMKDYVRSENPNATTEAFVPDNASAPETADY